MEATSNFKPSIDEVFLDGPQLPGYDLIEPLGTGAYGTVFLAIQQSTAMRVAIKVARLEGDPRREARFHRETSLCARVHHPHIVQLLDKGRQGNHKKSGGRAGVRCSTDGDGLYRRQVPRATGLTQCDARLALAVAHVLKVSRL
ncbi:protein kinase domain-containing protein [Bradyrhizobium sp. BR 10261]|uniref:protein kinase domain-containing protein n=1 Tax=Bradyrhizobium sp. BR 10261 TaxID=2749992 RepID=UPI001C650ABF|nr:protein kinase [Bradyrhizobium sp. BR 10261]MBW7966667.1 protein kinase [Bradyrhizobium sp. BR 10261]